MNRDIRCYKEVSGKFRPLQSDPENPIAIDEGFIRSAYEKNGLKLEREVHRGTWATNLPALSLQDMVIACAP